MEKDQNVFEKIGQYIVDCLDTTNWQQAILYIEIAEQSVGLRGKYVANDGSEKPFDTEGDFSLAKAILEFHQVSTENPKNRWNRATAILTSNYDFTLEYIWDQALHDEIEQLSM